MSLTFIQPVILSGGNGTRLWPLSRESHPKQYLPLEGGEKSMLQRTVQRLDGLARDAVTQTPLVVCNGAHRFLVAQQLLEAGAESPQIILEPQGRNTAPALTLAALQAVSSGEDPLLLAMPADHAVTDEPAFCQAIEHAQAPADKGAVVTFGVVPDRPETGYGYIRFDTKGNENACALRAFVEKPDQQTAQAYLESREYLWNSGIFMMRASVWLKALEALAPEMFVACRNAMHGATRDHDFIRPDAEAFSTCPGDSIDYAVMEKLTQSLELGIPAAVVPLSAGWSDLGAWQAVWETLPHDTNGNAVVGDALLLNSHNSLVHASDRFVAVCGVENVAVIETSDAVLVADKRQSQGIKKIVAQLKSANRPQADSHRKTHRPWGWYDAIDSGSRFQVKRIVVNPGASLSLQKHHHRAEHWIVVRGTAEVTNGNEVFLLTENQSTFIPLGHVHRLANPGKVPLELIEVQSGAYLGEDDIVRFEDTYGRAAQT